MPGSEQDSNSSACHSSLSPFWADWHRGGGRAPWGAGGCRALPSECHSGPQARHLASSPRESKAEAAQTKGQMKANGELGDFSLSPSSSRDWGLWSLAEDCANQDLELSSVQIPICLFYSPGTHRLSLPPLTTSHLGCYKKMQISRILKFKPMPETPTNPLLRQILRWVVWSQTPCIKRGFC